MYTIMDLCMSQMITNISNTCIQGVGVMLGLDPQVDLTNISNCANQRKMVIISFETKIVHGPTMVNMNNSPLYNLCYVTFYEG